jgi:hypothetical protein
VGKNTCHVPILIRIRYECHPQIKNHTHIYQIRYPIGIEYPYPNYHSYSPISAPDQVLSVFLVRVFPVVGLALSFERVATVLDFLSGDRFLLPTSGQGSTLFSYEFSSARQFSCQLLFSRLSIHPAGPRRHDPFFCLLRSL